MLFPQCQNCFRRGNTIFEGCGIVTLKMIPPEYIDSGIYQNADWVDRDGTLDDWHLVTGKGAQRGTALEMVLRKMDKFETT